MAPAPILQIVAALSALAAMAARKDKAGKLFEHYLERRATYLTDKNPGWLTETDYPSLAARIGSELDQIDTFVQERTTTLLGADPTTPKHRDLPNAAFRLTSFGASTIATWQKTYVRDRTNRIAAIAYRACAVHPELWSGGDATLAPALQTAPLTEVLDRRLAAVEMLLLHDSTLLYTKDNHSLRDWALASASKTAGWTDTGRATMFEYPWVDLKADNFQTALAAKGLNVAALAPEWYEDTFEKRIKLAASLNRPRQAAVGDWTVAGGPFDPIGSPYKMSLTGAGSRSAAFDRLIPIAPTTDPAFKDFLDRNFLYCDMTLAALHMHGLRMGRARRTGSDAAFDAAVTSVTLLPLMPRTGAPFPELLMASGSTWFDGTGAGREELQVGDHIVYWNNPFVRNLLNSAFGLENSLVTQVDADGHSLMLAGHGMGETTESDFSTAMAGEMTDNFDLLRAEIGKRYAADNTIVAFLHKLNYVPIQICKWAPFGENFTPSPRAKMTAPGAWWVRFDLRWLKDPNDPTDVAPTAVQAKGYVPRSIRYDKTKHTQTPASFTDDTTAFQEAVYIPLMTPHVRGGWEEYLQDPNPGGNVRLDDLKPDGSFVPGFFAKGSTTKIPVMRPKLTP